jgi:hypothetical protein
MGNRVAFIGLAAAGVLGLLGCGSADKGAVVTRTIQSSSITCISGCGVSFHSPNNHYTVKQVEEAFAAQGVRLRKAKNHEIPGYVVLRRGQKPPQLLAALVSTNQAATTGYVVGDSPPAYRIKKRGNVTVSFDSSDAQPVKSALSRLH